MKVTTTMYLVSRFQKKYSCTFLPPRIFLEWCLITTPSTNRNIYGISRTALPRPKVIKIQVQNILL
jgi:hypothetical protein